MSIDLTRPRQLVQDLTMLDECTITADADGYSDAVLDDNTGELVNPAPTESYSGQCSVKPDESRADTDEADVLLMRYVVTIPYDATGVKEGHRVTIDSSQDPDLVGAKLRVKAVEYKTLRVTRKLRCELEAPELESS